MLEINLSKPFPFVLGLSVNYRHVKLTMESGKHAQKITCLRRPQTCTKNQTYPCIFVKLLQTQGFVFRKYHKFQLADTFLKVMTWWERSYYCLFVLSQKPIEPSHSISERFCSSSINMLSMGGQICPKITHCTCNHLVSLNEVCYPLQFYSVIKK